jgi:SAM-dependent methyltransferase
MTSRRDRGSPPDTAFYDATYGRFAERLSASIRAQAFGEDIGQNSWLTADEYRTFFDWLGLDESSEVLEVASGSGGPALFMVREIGCHVTGIDLHERGVAAANEAAGQRGLADRARFVSGDARDLSLFEDDSFDAVVCIDSINHVYDRRRALQEWHRVLRPGGRALFTDPITVAGMIRREEMVVRSGSMGEFVFTPPGVDEGLLGGAGFDHAQHGGCGGGVARGARASRLGARRDRGRGGQRHLPGLSERGRAARERAAADPPRLSGPQTGGGILSRLAPS